MRGATLLQAAIIGTITAGSVSGCLLGPDYTAPEQQLGEAFHQPTIEGEAFANLPWWEIFTDPVLQGFVQEALEENRDLKVAVARIERARALLTFTKADQYPRLDLSGNALRQKSSETLGFAGRNPFNDFGLFGDLSFELDIWGKLRRATEAQQAELLATEYAQRAIVVSLVAQVASTYFRILGLDERLEISRRTIDNRIGHTQLIQARFSKGVVPQLDVNQAEIEEASAKADRSDFERDLRQSEHALSVLLGRVPGPVPRGKRLYQQSLHAGLPAGFPAALLERRPDVRSAEEVLRAEVARIGVAEANRYPSLNLLGFVGLESQRGGDFFEAGSFTWNIGGSLLGPIIDFGKSKSAQEAQEANALAALHNYEQTVLLAVQDVNDSLVAIRTYQESYGYRDAQTKSAQNAARLSRARYDEGVTSYLEVLDIERSLFEAELGASLSWEQYLVSVVGLYKALGGGWMQTMDKEENK